MNIDIIVIQHVVLHNHSEEVRLSKASVDGVCYYIEVDLTFICLRFVVKYQEKDTGKHNTVGLHTYESHSTERHQSSLHVEEKLHLSILTIHTLVTLPLDIIVNY